MKFGALLDRIFPWRERFVSVLQFHDKSRRPHIFALTNKRIVEIDYKTGDRTLVLTLKEAKRLKKVKDNG